MKTIQTYFKALLSLIPLGMIIFLLVIALVMGAASQISDPFNRALERMNLLNALEGEISANLGEMQAQETRLAFAREYELPEEDYGKKTTQTKNSIRQKIAELRENLDPESDADILASMQNFTKALDEHQQIFEDTLAALDDEDDEQALAALDELEFDNLYLNEALREVIIPVEQDRLDALAAFPQNANDNVLSTSVAMATCLLVAMLGYSIIASTVRPLRHLRNIMTAIAGDQYRIQAYQRELEQGGLAGELAHKLDQLARGEQTRSAGSKQEVEKLRLELYESRRRRLKLYHDAQKTE